LNSFQVLSTAFSYPIVPELYGTMALLYTLEKTGNIISIVRKSAKATTTWLGGACLAPIACFTKLSTTAILVKEVISIKKLGASERTVIMRKIVIAGVRFCSELPTFISMFGSVSPRSAGADEMLVLNARTIKVRSMILLLSLSLIFFRPLF